MARARVCNLGLYFLALESSVTHTFSQLLADGFSSNLEHCLPHLKLEVLQNFSQICLLMAEKGGARRDI